MRDWTRLRIMDNVQWCPTDDPFKKSYQGTVTEVADDHAIAKLSDGTTLWIDDDNVEEFYFVEV